MLLDLNSLERRDASVNVTGVSAQWRTAGKPYKLHPAPWRRPVFRRAITLWLARRSWYRRSTLVLPTYLRRKVWASTWRHPLPVARGGPRWISRPAPWRLQSTAQQFGVTVTGTANNAAGGVAATSALGTVGVTAAANTAVTGVRATSALGNVGVTADANVTATGVSAASALGSVSVAAGASVTVTGVSATSALGTVSVTADANDSITGVSVASALGTASVTGDANTTATGLSAASATGSTATTADANTAASGVSATGTIGDVTVTTGGGTDATVNATGVGAMANSGAISIQIASADGGDGGTSRTADRHRSVYLFPNQKSSATEVSAARSRGRVGAARVVAEVRLPATVTAQKARAKSIVGDTFVEIDEPWRVEDEELLLMLV